MGSAPKLKQTAAKHREGIGHLAYPPAGRRAAVKAGRKPVHFNLDGRTTARYFSGRFTATCGQNVHKWPTEDEGRGLVYLPPLSETEQDFCSLPFTKTCPLS